MCRGHDADRAAPQGVGHVKASGNYGSDIRVSIDARAEGYPTVLCRSEGKKIYRRIQRVELHWDQG